MEKRSRREAKKSAIGATGPYHCSTCQKNYQGPPRITTRGCLEERRIICSCHTCKTTISTEYVAPIFGAVGKGLTEIAEGLELACSMISERFGKSIFPE